VVEYIKCFVTIRVAVKPVIITVSSTKTGSEGIGRPVDTI